MTAYYPINRFKNRVKPYLFILPILIFAVAFVYYPFTKTFLQSFATVNAEGEILSYAGFGNFRYLFGRREFISALTNTLTLTVINVPATLIVSLALALLAAKKRPLTPIIETLFSMPMAVSMATASLIFRLMFNPSVGIINQIFGANIGWFEDSETALYTMTILTVWMGVGFNFLVLLQALRGIPNDRIGAAMLDGANSFELLIHIKLPAIASSLTYVLANNAILALMTSGPVMIITRGGPARSTTTLLYMMYTSGYASNDYSLAACISIVCFALAFGLTSLLMYLDRDKLHDI